MNEKTLLQLLNINLFRDFDKDELLRILSAYRTPLRVYPRERLVMLRGDPVDTLLIILKGRLQAQIQGTAGKTLRIEDLNTGQLIASGIPFSNDNRLPVSLYTETDVEILSIPKAAVLELCQKSSAFMQYYFTDMGDKISILAEKIRLYQFNTIRQKIAGYLLGLTHARCLSSVKLLHSKEVLAEMMGVTRPSLSREFSNLVADGIIEVKGKIIRILDRSALEYLLEEQEK